MDEYPKMATKDGLPLVDVKTGELIIFNSKEEERAYEGDGKPTRHYDLDSSHKR